MYGDDSGGGCSIVCSPCSPYWKWKTETWNARAPAFFSSFIFIFFFSLISRHRYCHFIHSFGGCPLNCVHDFFFSFSFFFSRLLPNLHFSVTRNTISCHRETVDRNHLHSWAIFGFGRCATDFFSLSPASLLDRCRAWCASKQRWPLFIARDRHCANCEPNWNDFEP